MKKSYSLLVAVSLLIAMIVGMSGCANKASSTKLVGGAKKVLATVGGEEITNGDIQEEFALMWKYQYEQIIKFNKDAKEEDFLSQKKRVLDQVLNDAIFANKANRWLDENKVVLDESRVDKEIKKMIFFQDAESEEALFENFKEKYGRTKEIILKQIKFNLRLTQYVVDEMTNKSQNIPTEEEVLELYEQRKEASFTKEEAVDLSVIMIDYALEAVENSEKAEQTEERTMDEAYALSDEILASLDSGKSFDKLAKKYSDSWSKEEGSLYKKRFSFQRRAPLTEEQTVKILALEEGAFSGVIDNARGGFLSIFKVIKKYPKTELSFEDMKEDIFQRLLFDKNSVQLQGLIEKIENSYSVEFSKEKEEEKSIFEETEKGSIEKVEEENVEEGDFDPDLEEIEKK